MKLAALGGALALVAASAAQAAPQPILPPVPYDAGPETFVGRLASDPPTNRVLNQMEIGARAFWRADYATARPALDDAILRIDSVFSDVADMEALLAWARASRGLGFEGMGCIHPRQIGPIHEGFAPTDQEVEKARLIVAAFEDA